jgi:hypothetical protein
MCRRRDEELAIVLLDAEEVCCRNGTVFCPTNSAYNEYPAQNIISREGIANFDACFGNPNTYQGGVSEIFMPDLVSTSGFRGLVFCDEQAHDYWLPRIQHASNTANPPPAFPEHPIEVSVMGSGRFRFPGDWRPTTRVRP